MLERRGIISGYEGSKPRQVLIAEADVPRILMHLAEADGAVTPVGGGGAASGDSSLPTDPGLS
jgi:S-DNA-T family DNA segregation ATPase FtsK/SpoIIIE